MSTDWALAFYELHSRVHWQPRETRCLQEIDAIIRKAPSRPNRRIVDLGSGASPLFPAIQKRGLQYFAVEIDASAVERAQERYGSSKQFQITQSSAAEGTAFLQQEDIVVLNGVMHHLGEREVSLLLEHLRRVEAVIILDHDTRSSETALHPIRLGQFLIQRLDRGKFLRPIEYFRALPHLTCTRMTTFDISVLGFPLWPYFCAVYTQPASGPA